MARPSKNGLDYFSMDVHMDDKFQLIEAEYGVTGFAVVVKLYQKIYGGFGYYCGWDSEVALLFARSCGLGGNAVSEIVNSALRRNLFSAEMLDKYGILTSSGIQKRYLEATSRRKSVELIEEYLLLDVSTLPDNVCINSINVDINPINAYRSTQSKVKESKGKQRKVEDTQTPARPDFNTVESYASSNLDYLSPTNMQDLIAFRETLPDDLIRYAIDAACANGVRKWAYVRSILARYQSAGYKTVGEVKNAEEQRTRQKSNGYNPTLNYDESAHYKKDQSGRYFDVLKHYGAKPNPALNYTQRSNEETNYSGTFINLLEEYGGNE